MMIPELECKQAWTYLNFVQDDDEFCLWIVWKKKLA